MRIPQRLHFVGIGGMGMSAIAQVMLEEGRQVTGSDLKLSAVTQRLAVRGATIFEGHGAEHVGGAQMVVRSSAVPEDNPEVQEGYRRGIPVIKRAAMLGHMMAEKQAIAVAGTHGKSTTSALIGTLLLHAGWDPTLVIGADLLELGSNGRLGRGPCLVAEADEFDGSLGEFKPWMAVITNVEPEHLDYYGTYEALLEAFRGFARQVRPEGYVLLCADDLGARGLADASSVTYGLAAEAHWRAIDPRPNDSGGYDFAVVHRGRPVGDFSTALPGLHNLYNALAAIAAGAMAGISPQALRPALAAFRGVARRFQRKGEVQGITIVDDYAHHPTEIKATLRAAREQFGGRRLLCLFQPHTYSRTKLLMDEFARAFGEADQVLITDIYAAREMNTFGVTSADLASALCHPRARWVGSLEDARRYVLGCLQRGDVLLTMGAGDIDSVGDWVLEDLSRGTVAGVPRHEGGEDDAAKK